MGGCLGGLGRGLGIRERACGRRSQSVGRCLRRAETGSETRRDDFSDRAPFPPLSGELFSYFSFFHLVVGVAPVSFLVNNNQCTVKQLRTHEAPVYLQDKIMT